MAWHTVHMASEKINSEAAALLAEAIARSDMSRAEVAVQTGIPLTTLRRKLMGRAAINLEDISLIATALQIAPSRVLPASLIQDEAA